MAFLPFQVGGPLLAGKGGYLQFFSWMVEGLGTTSASATQTLQTTLDVAWWKLHNIRNNPPLTYSGQFGARRRRTVYLDWTLQCRVWYDFTQPPDNLLAGDGQGIRLRLGREHAWSGDTGLLAQGNFTGQTRHSIFSSLNVTAPRFEPYCTAPAFVWSDQNIWDSSEGNQDEDGIVYQDILLEGDSLMWYISSQQLLDDFNGYVNQIAGQGELISVS